MADRLAELLAKAKTGKLTPAETEELARLLNAPILDPLENPAPGFVSNSKWPKRMLQRGSRLLTGSPTAASRPNSMSP